MATKKKFSAYIDDPPDWWDSNLEDYAKKPATAFLKEAVHLSDAFSLCQRHFTKKGNGEYRKDSLDGIYRLSAATLAAVMGHFETYQRCLFSGMVEATRLVPDFDIAQMCQDLEKDQGSTIKLHKLVGYRGQPAPVGQLIADILSGWHTPAIVNRYMHAIVKHDFFVKKEKDELQTLWQLRHSIVHTAGWLTQPDSQKVKELHGKGNQPILLNEKFVESVVRRLHPLVKNGTKRLQTRFVSLLPSSIGADERNEVDQLFRVISPRSSWF